VRSHKNQLRLKKRLKN